MGALDSTAYIISESHCENSDSCGHPNITSISLNILFGCLTWQQQRQYLLPFENLNQASSAIKVDNEDIIVLLISVLFVRPEIVLARIVSPGTFPSFVIVDMVKVFRSS